jgi:rubrerythrin
MSDDRLVITDGDCDTELIAEYEATRRQAVKRGLVGGGAAIAASAIPILLGVRKAFAQAEDDAKIVEGAVRLEQIAVVAYDTAYNGNLLTKPVADVAKLFRDQEQEHADALTQALQDLGGTAPEPPRPQEVEGLSSAKSQAQILSFAIDLENMAIQAYVDAHRKLQSPDLLKTGSQIISNEGQHLVVLRQALGASPAGSVPRAFEAGMAPPPK